jgi:hypothetical protein
VRALAFQLQGDRTMDPAAIDSCIEGAVAEKALAEERSRRLENYREKRGRFRRTRIRWLTSEPETMLLGGPSLPVSGVKRT